MTGTDIFRIVVRKFGYGQEFWPMNLLPIDQWTKIYLHHAVITLNLAIYLQIKRNRDLLLDTHKIAEQKPERKVNNELLPQIINAGRA